MSKTLLVAALLAVLGLGACNKDDSDPSIPGTYVDKGQIRYQNNSGDLYEIYLDDADYGNLYGGASSTYSSIPVGAHRVKALQKEHISGSATLRQETIFVTKDTVTTFSFP